MGIEPTQERLHAPAPDLKSGSPTSELGASKVGYIACPREFGNPSFFMKKNMKGIYLRRVPYSLRTVLYSIDYYLR